MTVYESIIEKHGSIHRNRCIDGSITGQSCCVGYCNYREHSGFLTEKQRRQHCCIEKGCHYYVPKQRTERPNKAQKDSTNELLNYITNRFSVFEGMKILRISETNSGAWKVNYITLSNDYPLENLSKELEKESGYRLIWNKLNYDFELCAQTIFSN